MGLEAYGAGYLGVWAVQRKSKELRTFAQSRLTAGLG